MIIGVAGVAFSGKDSLATLLQGRIPNSCILHLAHPLKLEVQYVLKDNFNLNVFTEDRREKDLFRPMLVEWGEIRRKQTKGLYFIALLAKRIKELSGQYEHFIIPDVRFKEYEVDEVDFIKNSGGYLIHLSRYSMNNGEKTFVRPANHKEEFNDPIVKGLADKRIEWEDFTNASGGNVQSIIDDLLFSIFKQNSKVL